MSNSAAVSRGEEGRMFKKIAGAVARVAWRPFAWVIDKIIEKTNMGR